MVDDRIIRDMFFVNGHSLEVIKIQAQSSNLPTIVMLHEGLGSVAYWKDFPSKLAEHTGSGVFAYSRYGHGGSDELREPRSIYFMHHEAQVVLPEVLQQAGIKSPLLFGHSDGGSIALIYAGTFPQSASGLILEAPHVFVEDLSVSSIAAARLFYQQTDMPQRLASYHTHADSMFWGWNNIWLDTSFRDWNIESFLNAICCPTMVLQGREDQYGTLKQVEAIRSKIPAVSITVLENCRHAPHQDQPATTLAAVRGFLQEHFDGSAKKRSK
jgi:pimeloyl-ACP methyl ester carboxylesterase